LKKRLNKGVNSKREGKSWRSKIRDVVAVFTKRIKSDWQNVRNGPAAKGPLREATKRGKNHHERAGEIGGSMGKGVVDIFRRYRWPKKRKGQKQRGRIFAHRGRVPTTAGSREDVWKAKAGAAINAKGWRGRGGCGARQMPGRKEGAVSRQVPSGEGEGKGEAEGWHSTLVKRNHRKRGVRNAGTYEKQFVCERGLSGKPNGARGVWANAVEKSRFINQGKRERGPNEKKSGGGIPPPEETPDEVTRGKKRPGF